MRDLEEAIGQYLVYQTVLEVTEPDRALYLAVPRRVFETLLTEKFGQVITSRLGLRLLVFDDQVQRIHTWIESNSIDRS